MNFLISGEFKKCSIVAWKLVRIIYAIVAHCTAVFSSLFCFARTPFHARALYCVAGSHVILIVISSEGTTAKRKIKIN